MKRLLFGIILSIVGLSYSLICFHGVVANPWYGFGDDGLLCALLEANTLVPFFVSLGLLLIGLLLTLLEAYRRK